MSIAETPEPPYYAVIFTSNRTAVEEGYEETAALMVELARQQPGFLGVESVRDGLGITVSYWRDLECIAGWKRQTDHQVAQRKGRTSWYQDFKLRIARVERDYGFSRP